VATLESKVSLKEANRQSIMQQIDKKILALNKAGEELGICERQIKKIRKCIATISLDTNFNRAIFCLLDNLERLSVSKRLCGLSLS